MGVPWIDVRPTRAFETRRGMADVAPKPEKAKADSILPSSGDDGE